MFWGKGSDKKPEDKASEAPPASPAQTTNVDPRKDATQFDPDKLPTRRKLPKGLQNIVDKADADESFFDDLVDG
jgi:fission process protein 1